MFIVYVNLVGGQDELIFDGNSMVFDKKGNIIFQAPEFEEGLYKTHIDIKNVENKTELKNEKNLYSVEEKIIYKGLVLGVKDYVESYLNKYDHKYMSGNLYNQGYIQVL